MIYALVVILTTIVLPAAFTALAWATGGGDVALLVARWFVFFAIGVRLSLAGVSQMLRPAATTAILGLDDARANILVNELGFANTAIGLVALVSLAIPAWTTPAGATGAIFLAFAGVRHAMTGGRNAREYLAMITDLLVAAIVGGSLLAGAAGLSAGTAAG